MRLALIHPVILLRPFVKHYLSVSTLKPELPKGWGGITNSRAVLETVPRVMEARGGPQSEN
jgi:hypothetical protein